MMILKERENFIRKDIDLDDLIFDYEKYHDRERRDVAKTCSDR